MSPLRWAHAVPVAVAAAWMSVAAWWTHGFDAFTSFSAARVAAGPLPRSSPALAVVDESGRRWDVSAPGPELRLVQAMYLRCPDVCPVAMGRLGNVRRELGGLVPSQVRIVSLSVDNDSPSALHAMWSAHGSPSGWSMAALTDESVAKTLERLGIWMFRRRDGLINHGLDILLLDRRGQVVRTFLPDDDASTIAAEVRRQLG